ncbi:hypothetical protein HaLaN_26507 [Haematococcus lacustris]|uniref:Uncharacterized protein n=1 Tax=Haematococcus lacustris TaxID=44745 RepID=A0A6A0A6F6_HAELA|nr:hypothetical protein HaLaN_26507 [Haematococcus lacustris]
MEYSWATSKDTFMMQSPNDMYTCTLPRVEGSSPRSGSKVSGALTESQLYSALDGCSRSSGGLNSRSTSQQGSPLATPTFATSEDQQQQLSQLPGPKALLHDLVVEAQQITGKSHRLADSTLEAAGLLQPNQGMQQDAADPAHGPQQVPGT